MNTRISRIAVAVPTPLAHICVACAWTRLCGSPFDRHEVFVDRVRRGDGGDSDEDASQDEEQDGGEEHGGRKVKPD